MSMTPTTTETPETAPAAEAHEHAEHAHHHVNYFYVFLALCVFTMLSVLFDMASFLTKEVVVVLVLAVATAKALSVMMYFMHLKFEGNWKFIILAPTTILAIGLMVALAPDQALHYYTPDVPQMKEIHNLPHTAADHQKDVDAHSDTPSEHSSEIPATVQ